MLMMRMQRIGRRNEAHFKIVIIEKSRGAKSQKYIDIVGSYNPKMGQVNIDTEKANKWLENGVQPSDTVYNFLIDKGVLEGKKKNVLPKKSPTKKRNAPDEPEPTPEPEKPVEEVAEVDESPTEETAAEPAPEEESVLEEGVATESEAVSEDAPTEVEEEDPSFEPKPEASESVEAEEVEPKEESSEEKEESEETKE